MELEVFFQFHLPYKSKEGDNASFMIATGPHISINTILGLPFQLETGAIVDFVDMVVECKLWTVLPSPSIFDICQIMSLPWMKPMLQCNSPNSATLSVKLRIWSAIMMPRYRQVAQDHPTSSWQFILVLSQWHVRPLLTCAVWTQPLTTPVVLVPVGCQLLQCVLMTMITTPVSLGKTVICE